LPYFDSYSNDIAARGFVRSSYLKGLDAKEFFFIHTSGRENLVDTAVKTEETGTTQRRMMKAFENAVVSYDNASRNTFGSLFNPIYNAGYAINKMVKTINKENKQTTVSFIDVVSIMRKLNIKRGWIPDHENTKSILSSVSLPASPLNEKRSSNSGKENIIIINNNVRKITLFEKTRLIGTRATQLSNNAKPLIDIEGEADYIKIAIKEYHAGVIPIYIIRRFTDGTFTKIYPTLENI
jgi:DNA-directed RNA polymerase subunit K/omega